MSFGGVYIISNNRSTSDNMIYNDLRLKTVFNYFRRRRIYENNRTIAYYKRGLSDGKLFTDVPSLVEISRSHIIPCNANWLNVVKMAHTYLKCNSISGGTQTFSGEITVEIPDGGELFSDGFADIGIKQPTLTAGSDTDLSNAPMMAWCPYIGERIFDWTRFAVSNNKFDEYTSTAVNMYRETELDDTQRRNWARCMGQELPQVGMKDQGTWANSGINPTTITSRAALSFYNGHQTPTGQKLQTEDGDVNLTIPFLFWFRNIEMAFPYLATNASDKQITMKITDRNKLVRVVPRGIATYSAPNGTLTFDSSPFRRFHVYFRHIFIPRMLQLIYVKHMHFLLTRLHKEQQHNASRSDEMNIKLDSLRHMAERVIFGAKHVNYTSSEAHIAEYMDYWHKFGTVTPTVFVPERGTYCEQKLKMCPSSLGFDAKTMEISIPDAKNVTGDVEVFAADGKTSLGTDAPGVLDALQEGDTIVFSTATGVIQTVITRLIGGPPHIIQLFVTAVATTLPIPVLSVSATYILRRPALGNSVTVDVLSPIFKTVGLEAQGITLFHDLPMGFYTNYTQLDSRMAVPESEVGQFIFAFAPKSEIQPTGHLDVSRAIIEFRYFCPSSTTITSVDPCIIYFLACVLNFVYVTNGNAIVRYVT